MNTVLLTLAGKDLRLLVRDRAGFFFTFFFPLLYAIFFGVLFAGTRGGPTAIDVALVDEDHSPGAARFIDSLKADKALRIEVFAARSSAADAVARGARPAYVIVPAGFGAASERVFWGEPMTVEIGTDPGQSMTAGLIEGLITSHAYEQMQRAFTDRDLMRRNARSARSAVEADEHISGLEKAALGTLLMGVEQLGDISAVRSAPSAAEPNSPSASAPAAFGSGGWQPVVIASRAVTRTVAARPRAPASSFAICFPQGLVWGVLACATTFAVTLVTERSGGTLPRLLVAPLPRWQIIAGKALACFIATFGLMTVLLVVARVGFGVHPRSVPLLAGGMAAVSIAVVGLMMLLSVIARTEAAVSGISWAMIIVMAMFGGGMLPLAFMPAWMKPLSSASIVKWAILALEGPLWRGYTPAEMLLPCGVLVAVGLVGSAFGVWRLRAAE